jgi:mono/diheme cytochrome c family protein
MSERARTRRTIRSQRAAAARRRRAVALSALAAAALAVVVGVVVAAGGDEEQPTTPREAQLATGAAIFDASCSTCHGDDLTGTFVGPPLVDDIYAPDHHGDDAIRAAIADGVQPHHWDFAAMPPIGGLDAAEVEAVIAHIRAVQEAAGVGTDP